jgi:Protein of unknown function (DUF3489)
MTKLSDTQLVILSAAAKRPTLLALPLPTRLKGGAAHKVIKPLISEGLLEEVAANVQRDDPVWRETGDGHRMSLIITAAGLEAICVDSGSAPAKSRPAKTPRPLTASPQRPKHRADTKQAEMIALLHRAKGATLDELVNATGWQAHTVRGAMAGALKKRHGLTIVSEKIETRGRVYRIER